MVALLVLLAVDVQLLDGIPRHFKLAFVMLSIDSQFAFLVVMKLLMSELSANNLV